MLRLLCLGNHKCHVCQEVSGTVQRCSHRDCGRFYHTECISRHPLAVMEDSKLTCPLHVCASCARGDPNNEKAAVGKSLISL